MEQKRKAGDIGDSCSKKTKSGNEENWQRFSYQSYPPERNRFNKTAARVVYTHWLPDDYSTLVSDGQYMYTEFDTLIHATSFKAALKIFKTGKLEQQLVKDSSIVSPHTAIKFNNIHPLARSKIVWYGPYQVNKLRKADESIERYGNIIFSMKTLNGSGGIMSDTDEFRYYFVEIIDYVTQSACRILVTKKEYPDLLPYDPTRKGGPWYINVETGKHHHLIKITNSNDYLVKNTVEFMREEESYEPFETLWLANHHLSYKECYNPRRGVDIPKDSIEGRLRLALGCLGCKTKYKENKILQDWAVIPEDGIDVIDVMDKFNFEFEKSCIVNDNTEIGLDIPTFTMEDILAKTIDGKIYMENNCSDMKTMYFKMLSSIHPSRRLHFIKTLKDALKSIFFNGKSQKEKLNHKVIKLRQDWQYFNFTNMHDVISNKSGQTIACIHWLPKDYNKLGKVEDYEEFDMLVKSPTETNFTIDEGNYMYGFQFRPSIHFIDDCSVVNPSCTVYEIGEEKGTNYLHPLARSKVFRYYAETKKNIEDKTYKEETYGNAIYAMICFGGWEGIFREPGDYNYYLVEIIDFPKKSVCRILVTRKSYSSLLRYDEKQSGGPWDGGCKQFRKIQNSKGEIVEHQLEFLREEVDDDFFYPQWQRNHKKVD